MENRFINIGYDEASGDGYRGIEVANREKTLNTFATGDVVKDFADMVDWCAGNPISGRYMFQSSVDHFVMDVPGYRWEVDENGREVIRREVESAPDAPSP